MIFHGKMTFGYGDNGIYPGVKTTFQAVKLGLRTSTTRLEKDGHLDYWKRVKAGDIIIWTGANGEQVETICTVPLRRLKGSGITRNEWCKKEGWNAKFMYSWLLPHLDEAWQMEYKLKKEV